MGQQYAIICKCDGTFLEKNNLKCDYCKETKKCFSCADCYTYVCHKCMTNKAKELTRKMYCYKADKPFSNGACRYAYKGYESESGNLMSTKSVVIKKFIDETAYSSNDWKGDVKCYKKCIEFINEWNKLGIVNKKYIMYEPIIIKAGTDCAVDHDKKESIEQGEYIMVERYLEGEYEKWNSNSGWFVNQSMSIQAFCHWTYHYSKGNFLMCDAQGVRAENNYYITDPAILSIVAGQYGCTDIGKEGIQQWFGYHACNEFCDKKWTKPGNVKRYSFPVKKNSTYRWKTRPKTY
eukprot:157972_1